MSLPFSPLGRAVQLVQTRCNIPMPLSNPPRQLASMQELRLSSVYLGKRDEDLEQFAAPAGPGAAPEQVVIQSVSKKGSLHPEYFSKKYSGNLTSECVFQLGVLRQLRRLELHLRRDLGVGIPWQFAQLAPHAGQLTALKLSGRQVHVTSARKPIASVSRTVEHRQN